MMALVNWLSEFFQFYNARNLTAIKVTAILLWITIKLILVTAMMQSSAVEFIYEGF